MPAGGAVNRTGKIGYLPQDPRTGDEPGTVIERILSARDLDQISHRMRAVEEEMATAQGEALEKAMDRYTRAELMFNAGVSIHCFFKGFTLGSCHLFFNSAHAM